MSFTILLLSSDADPSWPEKIRRAVPGAVAKAYADPQDALADIATADAAYGSVPPELLARAKRLRWICASRAGLGDAYFYDALVKSDVVVTGRPGRRNEHLSIHAVAFPLAFAWRGAQHSRNSPGCYVNSSVTRSTNCSAVSIAAPARSSGTSVSGPSP